MYFYYFNIIFPFEQTWECVWNQPSDSGEEEFWKVSFAISLLSPLEKTWDPSFEQNWILFTQRCFVPSLVEISPLVLEKKQFKFRQCIFPILLSSPLGKGRGPSFEQTRILFTRECLVPSLVEISPMVLEKIF